MRLHGKKNGNRNRVRVQSLDVAVRFGTVDGNASQMSEIWTHNGRVLPGTDNRVSFLRRCFDRNVETVDHRQGGWVLGCCYGSKIRTHFDSVQGAVVTTAPFLFSISMVD